MDEEIRAALGLEDTATAADAVSAIAALQASATATAGFDPEAFVPRADYDAAIASLEDYRQRDAAALEQALDDAVDEAVASQKIAPASKEMWRETVGIIGLERFHAHMAERGPMFSTSTAAAKRTTALPKRTADATEAAIAAAFGYTPDQLSEGTH